MMPLETEQPQEEFLARCRSLARAHGALFILDEVRTGFRLAVGGAQEYFGVQADLVALSKAMANGYCISAVTGAEEILSTAEKISLSSVFFRSREAMAAANATIGQIVARDANPKTYRKSLFEQLPSEYFFERNSGQWLRNSEDMILHPKMVELAGPRAHFIPECLYVHDVSGQEHDFKDLLTKADCVINRLAVTPRERFIEKLRKLLNQAETRPAGGGEAG